MNMLSLYDYLGYPAGSALGKEVWETAEKSDIKTEIREISNPKYSGKVMLYPKDFLEEYFESKQSKLVLSSADEDDDLPF